MARGVEALLQDKFIRKMKLDPTLVAHFKSKGGLSWLPKGGGQFFPVKNQNKGYPDLTIIYNKQNIFVEQPQNEVNVIFIEFKTEHSKLTAEQLEFWRTIYDGNFKNAKFLVFRPVDWEIIKLTKTKTFLDDVFNYDAEVIKCL